MESPRELAAKIADGEDPWVDTDAQTVAVAYLELLAAATAVRKRHPGNGESADLVLDRIIEQAAEEPAA